MRYHIEFDLDFKRNTYKGLLIAIEGIDGAGKTTQAKLLSKELSKKYNIFETKNPTDHEIGQLVRRVLSGEIKIPPIALQFLFSADRQVQQVEIIERLKNGEVIILDRYFWSAVVYGSVDLSGANFEESTNQLLISQGILSMYHKFIVPDITIYLKIPIHEVLERIKVKKDKLEIYEHEDKLRNIEKGYNWLVDKFKNEFRIVDGTRNEGEISKEILDIINDLKQKKDDKQ